MLQFVAEIAAGVVAADLDRDGLVDLFFPQIQGTNHLYWGTGEGWEAADPGAHSGLGDFDQLASAADYDGDGDLDLIVGGVATLKLLRLDGREFTDVTADAGLSAQPGYSGATCWGDADGDGDLDLFVGGYVLDLQMLQQIGTTVPDRLYRNDGGTFADITDQLPWPGDPGDGATLHCAFRDFDGDGDADLLKVNDFTDFLPRGALWERTADGWVDRLDSSGIVSVEYGMGALAADLDGDGDDEIWMSNIGKPAAYEAIGPFDFVDRRLDWAADLPHNAGLVSWSVVPFDLSGDGAPGVFVTYGPLNVEPNGAFGAIALQDDVFLRPRDGTFFNDLSAFDEILTSNDRGVAVADLDGDHRPDLLVGRIDEAPVALRHPDTGNRWLRVELRQDGMNRHGVGARVHVTAGGRTRVQEVTAGGVGSFSGQGPELYFGLGSDDPTEVRVVWPGGDVQTVSDGLCADCRLIIGR